MPQYSCQPLRRSGRGNCSEPPRLQPGPAPVMTLTNSTACGTLARSMKTGLDVLGTQRRCHGLWPARGRLRYQSGLTATPGGNADPVLIESVLLPSHCVIQSREELGAARTEDSRLSAALASGPVIPSTCRTVCPRHKGSNPARADQAPSPSGRALVR